MRTHVCASASARACLCAYACAWDIMQVDRYRGFTDTVCLQNKTISLQTRYVYKTKQKQNSKFTDTLCLQNKTVSL